METDIVDATTGDPVPISRLMLHHIVFLNVLKPDSTCNSFLSFDSQDRARLGGIGAPALLRRRRGAGEAVAAARLRLSARLPATSGR